MIYRSLALVSMATFYIIYFVKLFLQKKRGISVYKLAQNEKKSKKNITEILLKIVSFLLPVLELVSIVIGRSYLPIITGRGNRRRICRQDTTASQQITWTRSNV